MTTIIRPGLMVSVKSTVTGGIHYEKKNLTEEGNVAEWTTRRTTDDPLEHERAIKARGAARTLVTRLCASTAFGLLCPQDGEAELDAAITQARTMAREFNATSNYTQIGFRVMKGRIAATDQEAAKAIGEEVRELIEQMSASIDKLDPTAMREAATKAKQLATMLSPEQAAQVGEAIEAVRKAARQVVKRVEKGGEDAAVVLLDIQRGAIEKARIAFLDLDSDVVEVAPLPTVAAQRFADLEEDDEAPAEPKAQPATDDWMAANAV